MTRRACKFLLVLILLFGAFTLRAAGNDPARRLWMNGYEAMTKADKSLTENADLAALHGYEKALQVFQDVQNKYPGWNVSLITYRIEYCRRKIAEIKEANSQNLEYLTKDELFSRISTQAQEVQSLKERLSSSAQELERLRQSLERARAEAASLAANEENIEILKRDREVLKGQVRTLTGQLNSQKEELKRAQTPDPRMLQVDELTEQLKRSQAELARTGRTLEQTAKMRDDLLAQNQRDGRQRAQLESEKSELQRLLENERGLREKAELELQKSRLSVKSLQEEMQRLQSEKPVDATLSEQEAAALRSQLATTDEKLQSARMELLNAERKLKLAEMSVTRLSEELSEERIRSSTNADAVSEQLRSAGALHQENAELRDQSARQERSISAMREMLSSMERKASENEAKMAEMAAESNALKSQVASLQTQLEATQADLQTAEEKQKLILSANQASDGIVETAVEAETERGRLSRKVAELEVELTGVREELSREQAASRQAREQVASLNAKADDASARIWQERSEELQRQIERMEQRQSELEGALVRRDQEKQSLARELDELKDQGAGVPLPSTTTASRPAGLEVPVALPRPEEGVSRESGLSAPDQVILKGFLRQGVDAERAGKLEAAQWNYQQALSLQPDNFLAMKRLGIIASGAGNDGEAARYLSAATRVNPDDAEVLIALGFAQLQLKQPEWALANLTRASALKPQDPKTARLLGVALGVLEWREAAMVQLKKALELDGKDGEAAFNLAMLALTRSSELDFQARREPAFRGALEHLASSMRKEGLDWYRKAVENGVQEDPKLEEALSR